MYNVFGQKVKVLEHLSGNSIRIAREKLPEGVYIYEVVEKDVRIGNGKLVVE